MGEVISFEKYQDGKKILLMTAPCDRPFHLGDYVSDLRCLRCDVKVQITEHPSLPEPRWHG